MDIDGSGGRQRARSALGFVVEPPPDTKDWTWTLTRRCDQCGFAAGEVDLRNLLSVPSSPARSGFRSCSSPAVSARPQPDVWSPLEYGAHVRDVYRLFDARLAQMLSEDTPTFANWNQDEAAIKERYGEQDPEVVADELEAAAHSVRCPDTVAQTGAVRTTWDPL